VEVQGLSSHTARVSPWLSHLDQSIWFPYTRDFSTHAQGVMEAWRLNSYSSHNVAEIHPTDVGCLTVSTLEPRHRT